MKVGYWSPLLLLYCCIVFYFSLQICQYFLNTFKISDVGYVVDEFTLWSSYNKLSLLLQIWVKVYFIHWVYRYPCLFWFILVWSIFFHPFTLYLYVSLKLKWPGESQGERSLAVTAPGVTNSWAHETDEETQEDEREFFSVVNIGVAI